MQQPCGMRTRFIWT